MMFTRHNSTMAWGRALRPLKRAVPKLAMDRQGWHTFRRSVGSLLAMEGVDIHAIAKVLGHKNVQLTIDHYAHLSPERASKELERL